MRIEPIKSDRDHRRALREIERLMDARPGTPEGDRLGIPAESLIAEPRSKPAA